MMFDRHWVIPQADPARDAALAASAGVSPVTAGVLVRRGVDTPEAMRRFLSPRLDDLSDPAVMKGVPEAARRIAQAVRERQRIWICGDYDVDGTSGTAILLHFFRRLGAPARFHIPHRVKDGYGLRIPAVELMAEEGADVAITVDNGISAVEAAARAKALGIALIITDHHEPPDPLPDCFALINPKQPGCTSAFKELCGAGLAFKLAWAVAQELGPARRATPEMRGFLLEALGIVALATVADVAPLEGENRILVRYGMQALDRTRLPGLVALKRLAGVDGAITEREIAFGLGPRINAGGRLAGADLAVRLLTTEDAAEAEKLAAELEALNLERRQVERRVVEEAAARVGDPAPSIIALGDEAWHLGVLGIAASKLAERFSRPVLLASWDKETGTGRGSGRSIPGFHLTEALASAREHLVAYGGHAYASGFTVRREAFDSLRASLESSLSTWSGGEAPAPLTEVDLEVSLEVLREGVVSELAKMAPYGEGNRPPVLMARGLRLAGEPSRMGKEGGHLSFLARRAEGNGPALRVVAFRQGEALPRLRELAAAFDLAFTPKLNVWKGRIAVELEAVALRPARSPAPART